MHILEEEEVYVIMPTDGEMTMSDIRQECQEDTWTPILFIKEEKTIPYFTILDTANKFRLRNLPKKDISGVVSLTNADIQDLTNRGFTWKHYTFPNKINLDLCDIEIHKFVDRPDIIVNYI